MNPWLKRGVLALGLLIVTPGALLGLLALYWLSSVQADADKMHEVHRWSPAKPAKAVLFWARFWSAVYRVPWALQLSILNNEGASASRPATDEEVARFPELAGRFVYPLGDLDINRSATFHGPSWGPGQMLETNGLELYEKFAGPLLRWLVKPSRMSDLALPGSEFRALWLSARMLRRILDDKPAARDDLNEAAASYNGGEHHKSEAAQAYGERSGDLRAALA